MEIKRVIKETATQTINGFKVEFNYEFQEGEKPEMIQARASKEGSDNVVDCYYYGSTRNVQFTVHYLPDEFDSSTLTKILTTIKDIAGIV